MINSKEKALARLGLIKKLEISINKKIIPINIRLKPFLRRNDLLLKDIADKCTLIGLRRAYRDILEKLDRERNFIYSNNPELKTNKQ